MSVPTKRSPHHPEEKGWLKILKIAAFWGIAVIILSSFAVLRYTSEVFFDAPKIFGADLDEPTMLSREGAFVLEFDQRMNQESVAKALEISPSLPYRLEWRGRELAIDPEKELEIGQNFTLTIKKSAKSIFGKRLIRDYSIRYTVGKDPHIVRIFPATPEMRPDEKIILIFSHAMVSEQEIGRDLRPDFLQLTPLTQGGWIWRDAKTLVFSAEKNFAPSTQYHLTSIKPLKTYDGTAINQQIDQSFSTERLAVVKDEVEGQEVVKAKWHSVDEPFLVRFTQPISIASLREHIQISDSTGKKLDQFSITPVPDEPFLYAIKSRSQWQYHETYQVVVGAGSMPETGNIGLQEDSTFVFETEPFLLEASVPDELVRDDVLFVSQNALHVTFPEEVGETRLKQALYFVPTIPFEVVSLNAKDFSIVLNDNSQKRENIKMYLSDAINTSVKKILSHVVSFELKDISALALDLKLADGKICFLSNYPLGKKSHALAQVSGREEKWQLDESSLESPCKTLKGDDKPFTAELSQAYLEPNAENILTLYAEDVFQQQKTEKFSVITGSITTSDTSISIDDNSALHYFQNQDQLTVEYQTKNVRTLKAELCKMSSEVFIAVETTQEERWRSFTPSAEKCLRYKILQKEIQPRWGRIERHQLKISEGLPEPDPGIYLVKLSLPTFLDPEGKPFQENIIVQYTPWNILSKRGESALVWLTDEQRQPINGANVVFYANDGSAQIKRRTDEQGMILLQDKKAQYEFIAVTHQDQELVLNSFDQEGFEPQRYGVPFNTEETPYRYQFYTEDFNASPRQIRGVFILRERVEGRLVIPQISSAVVTLTNQQEEILWRSIESFDDFGNVFFDITPPIPIFDGVYQLSVCLGLHEGVCHGTSLWTTIVKGQSGYGKMSPESPNSSDSKDQKESVHLQIIAASTSPKAGDQITLSITGLEPNVPVLLTAERDVIEFSKVFLPTKESFEATLTLSEAMIPEAVFTVTQFQTESVLYDVKALALDRQQKILTKENTTTQGKVNQIVFQLNENTSFPENFLANSFYPRLGTSITTAATARPQQDVDQGAELTTSEIPMDLVVIDGTLLASEMESQNVEVEPRLELYQDGDGRFGAVATQRQEIKPEVSITSNFPDFVREGDRIIAEVIVSNAGNGNKNIQLIGTGKGAAFLSDRSTIIGLAPGQKRTLHIALQVGAVQQGEMIQLDFEAFLENDVVAHHQQQVPLAHLHAKPLHKKVMILESKNGQGMISLPLQHPQTASRAVLIGLSPLSFALENLRMMLHRDTLHLEEIVFAAIAESSYGHLLQPSEAKKNELRDIIKIRQNTDDVIAMLQTKQKNDGGWSDDSQQVSSQLMTSVWIAKALSIHEQAQQRAISAAIKDDLKALLKEELDKRVNARLADQGQAGVLTPSQIFEELLVLNALSSLTPSGVSYANNWYLKLQELSNESLVLLLLTFEDFRDAGIAGVNFKIEEMIQVLKTRQRQDQYGVFLEKNAEIQASTPFLITSWYLEALVRQASARTDLPSVITWLVHNKYRPEYLGPQDQFTFLAAMASYLRIFQEDIRAKNIEITLDNSRHQLDVSPEEKFQTFLLEDTFLFSGVENAPPTVRFSADQEQPIFLEVNWEADEKSATAVSKGISAWVSFSKSTAIQQGDIIEGSISIISPESRRKVIVSQPLLAAIKDAGQEAQEMAKGWQTQTFGNEEKWYLFDELPAGETVIPFRWEFTSPGMLQMPSVYAFVLEEPDTYALSTRQEIEVRPR